MHLQIKIIRIKLPCTGEPGSHVGEGGQYMAVDEAGFDESADPEMWVWIEAEQLAELHPGIVEQPPPGALAFPADEAFGSRRFRHYKFQHQIMFIQPPD